MSYRLIIVGAGGTGREALYYAQECQRAGDTFSVGGFLDDNPDALQGYDVDVGVIGNRDYRPQPEDAFVIAVGDPHLRAELKDHLETNRARLVSVVHPTAFVATNATLGPGCLVAPLAFIGAHSTVASNVLVNVHAVVGHDARIGEHCVLCPGASASGFTVLEPLVFMGTNAVVVPGKSVGRGSQIAAGSVVYNNVEADQMALGNPARARKLASSSKE